MSGTREDVGGSGPLPSPPRGRALRTSEDTHREPDRHVPTAGVHGNPAPRQPGTGRGTRGGTRDAEHGIRGVTWDVGRRTQGGTWDAGRGTRVQAPPVSRSARPGPAPPRPHLALQVEVDESLHVLEVSVKLVRGVWARKLLLGCRSQEPTGSERERPRRPGRGPCMCWSPRPRTRTQQGALGTGGTWRNVVE